MTIIAILYSSSMPIIIPRVSLPGKPSKSYHMPSISISSPMSLIGGISQGPSNIAIFIIGQLTSGISNMPITMMKHVLLSTINSQSNIISTFVALKSIVLLISSSPSPNIVIDITSQVKLYSVPFSN